MPVIIPAIKKHNKSIAKYIDEGDFMKALYLTDKQEIKLRVCGYRS